MTFKEWITVGKLVVELLGTVAWPTVVLVAVVLFRHEVTSVLGRLKKAVLPGGVEIDLAEEVREIRRLSETVEAAPPPPKPPAGAPSIPLTEANARMISLGLRPSPSGLDARYYREIAERDPVLALAGLRIEIEILFRNLAQGFNIEVSEKESPGRLLRLLEAKEAITHEQAALIGHILRTANAAVHGTAVSGETAALVIDSAAVLMEQYLDWLGWGFPDDWHPVSGSPKPSAA